MRRYYINGGSGAGMRDLINAQSKNSWGMTILSDELSGHFKSQKKSYNVGQTEDLLSYYDGFGKIDALKGGLASDFEECLVSILGGIQPKVIREFNDGSDDNGNHSRFNFINQPTQPFIIPDDPQASLDLLPLITGIYERISELPQLSLRLSPDAQKQFHNLNNKCENYRVNAKSQALAALWGKMPGKIGRLAALIHVVERVASGQEITSLVERGTLNKAAKLAKFYFKESQSLYAGCGDELAPQLVKILNFAQRRGTEITAREVKQSDRSFGKPDEIRTMFTQLVSLGYGSVVGSGCRLKYKFSEKIPTVDNCRPTVVKTVDGETTFPVGLQPIVDIVDKNKKNISNLSNSGTVDIQPIMDALQNPIEVEKASTVVYNSPNPDSEASTVSTVLSTDCLQLSTDFDSLKPGDVLIDCETKQPHQLTKITKGMWLAHSGERISRNDLREEKFTPATADKIQSLMEITIVHRNKSNADFLLTQASEQLKGLISIALTRNSQLEQIKDYPSWP